MNVDNMDLSCVASMPLAYLQCMLLRVQVIAGLEARFLHSVRVTMTPCFNTGLAFLWVPSGIV